MEQGSREWQRALLLAYGYKASELDMNLRARLLLLTVLYDAAVCVSTLCVWCPKLLISRSTNWEPRSGHLQQSNSSHGVITADAPLNNPFDLTPRMRKLTIRSMIALLAFSVGVTCFLRCSLFLAIDLLYNAGSKGHYRPVLRNVWIEKVTSTGSPRYAVDCGFSRRVH